MQAYMTYRDDIYTNKFYSVKMEQKKVNSYFDWTHTYDAPIN